MLEVSPSVNAGSGKVNLFELSFNTPAELDSLQAGDFTLGTLIFDVVGAGTSILGITVNSLGDADGNPLTVTLENGTVTSQPGTLISTPGSLFLMLSGFLPLVVMRKGIDGVS